MQTYLGVLKNYAVFDGRAMRSEYWLFALINFIIGMVLYILSFIVAEVIFVYLLYGLAVLIPGLAVGARRLHDTGRSGWWQLVAFIPLLGVIVLIIMFVQPSEPSDNMYGPQPQGSSASG